MKFEILLLFLWCILNLNTIKAEKITVNAIAFSFNTEKNNFYSTLANAFNEYAKSKNLEVELNLEILTPENSTIDYPTLIDECLSKKNNKYDIYFDIAPYTYQYGKYFADLRKYIDENVLDEIAPSVLSSGVYDGALVGVPYNINVLALYSNQHLLSKYEKKVPKTWDELIDTVRYILQKEKKENPDLDLIGYNGQMNDENAVVSAYAFIHSFRSSNESPHPELTSPTTVEALEKLKYLKEQIASDEIFQEREDYTIFKVFLGDALFLQYWYLPLIHNPVYATSALPGNKEGVSGSLVIANSLGICNSIDEDRIKAAAEVVKFIISKDTQRKYVIPSGLMSAIPGLYEDEQVCQMVNCDLIKAASPLSSMESSENGLGNESISSIYRDNIKEYLFGNLTAAEAVENIHNLMIAYEDEKDKEDHTDGLSENSSPNTDNNNNNKDISDSNLNAGTDAGNGKPQDENSGASSFKALSFLSVWMMLTIIFIW